ncbi:MAG: methylated-DNA--[protein]-cysteine S-methyltransferase [Pseudomonadota bacterium]
MKPAYDYAAKYLTPFAVLGIRVEEGKLAGIDFLPLGEATLAPSAALTRQVCEQIEAYLHDADFQFDLPLRQSGTLHQMKVWQAMSAIPCGQATTYGALAQQLGSSPRAVGQACGSNPLPLIIPCHRVVAKNGAGGFMHHASGAPLAIKDWLLRHEGYQR